MKITRRRDFAEHVVYAKLTCQFQSVRAFARFHRAKQASKLFRRDDRDLLETSRRTCAVVKVSGMKVKHTNGDRSN